MGNFRGEKQQMEAGIEVGQRAREQIEWQT